MLGMHAHGLSYRLIARNTGVEQEQRDGDCQAKHWRALGIAKKTLLPTIAFGIALIFGGSSALFLGPLDMPGEEWLSATYAPLISEVSALQERTGVSDELLRLLQYRGVLGR